MKIIIINGSPRTKGSTATILHQIENELIASGVETEYFDLKELQINPCSGCCSCFKTGHCYINDDAEKLSELIGRSDGLVIGSPTYASNVSGIMKQFIDRGHFVIEQLLHNKFCITVSTGENYGYRNTLKILNDLVLYSGGNICGSIAVKAPFAASYTVNDKIRRKCSTSVRKMIRQHRSPLQAIAHKIIFRFGIRPFVLKKGAAYQGVIDRWRFQFML